MICTCSEPGPFARLCANGSSSDCAPATDSHTSVMRARPQALYHSAQGPWERRTDGARKESRPSRPKAPRRRLQPRKTRSSCQLRRPASSSRSWSVAQTSVRHAPSTAHHVWCTVVVMRCLRKTHRLVLWQKLYETKAYKKALKSCDSILKKYPTHGGQLLARE